MQLREISLKWNVTFYVFYFIEVLIQSGTFLKAPPELNRWFQVMSN